MLKRQFLYEVRTNQDNVKRINLLSFMNFKRTLSGSKGNTTSLKHSIQKRVTKYFFQKKKSYKFHKFYRRQLSFTCTNTEPNAFYLLSLRKKLVWRHAKFSLKLFRKKGIKKAKTSKNSMILLHSSQHSNTIFNSTSLGRIPDSHVTSSTFKTNVIIDTSKTFISTSSTFIFSIFIKS
jgi:hypothetical protein